MNAGVFEAYGPPLVVLAAASGLSLVVFALRMLSRDEVRKSKGHSGSVGEFRVEILALEMRLRDNFIDPIHKALAEVQENIAVIEENVTHVENLTDGTRDDMRQLRADVRHDLRDIVTPVFLAQETQGEKLKQAYMQLEDAKRERAILAGRITALEDAKREMDKSKKHL